MSTNDEQVIRVERVLVYEGPRSWVEQTLAKSCVLGRTVILNGENRYSISVLSEQRLPIGRTFPEEQPDQFSSPGVSDE